MPEIVTPRAAKLLIIAAVFIGELFTTGYFFDAQDKTSISESGSAFVGQAAIFSIASALLMVPLKIIISLFLAGKPLDRKATRAQLDASDRSRILSRKIGYILIALWLAGCGWGVAMFVVSFTEPALDKWLITYFATFFHEVVIVFQLKVLFKVLIALLLMKLMRSPIMLTVAGAIAEKIVDFIMKWF